MIGDETPYYMQFVDKPLPAPLTPPPPSDDILERLKSASTPATGAGSARKSPPGSALTQQSYSADHVRTAESEIAARMVAELELSSTAVSSSKVEQSLNEMKF